MTMLGHLAVLELTEGLGDYAGCLLAQLGARVSKLAAASATPVPAAETREEAIARSVWNSGKEFVPVDPDRPEDRARLRVLMEQADVLLLGGASGALPDLLDRAGLPAPQRAALNQRLIEVAVAPFAAANGRSGEPATDLTLMAMSGIMHTVGDSDRPPLTLPGRQATALAGIQAAIAALLAVTSRARTGLGQTADVSALQSAVLAGYRDPIMWEWTGRIGRRSGNQLVRGSSGVRQVWRCRDGYVTWSLVDNPAMVRGVVALMAAEDLAGPLAEVDWEHTLLAETEQSRIDSWEALIEQFFLAHDRAELACWSEERALGLSPIEDVAAVLAEPHWQDRGFWREEVIDGISVRLPGQMFVFHGAASAI